MPSRYRGQIELVPTSYALNERELADVCGAIERNVLLDVIGVVAGDSAGALSEIVEQVEGLVPGPPNEPPKSDDTNPFAALLDFGWAKATKSARESSAH